MNLVKIRLKDSTDLDRVEAAVRGFSRSEPRGACPPLQTLTYRTFRLQCLRALAACPPAPRAFDANLGSSISLSYSEGTVSALLRSFDPGLPLAASAPRKRKKAMQGGDSPRSPDSDGSD